MSTTQTKRTKGRGKPELPAEKEKSVCPNCGQWQTNRKYNSIIGIHYLDCFNDCAERGFAPKAAHTDTRASGAPEAPRHEHKPGDLYYRNLADGSAELLAQHSPLPWRASDSNICIFSEQDQTRVCTLNQSLGPQLDANAKLIVASVNNAEALAEALRALLHQHESKHEQFAVAEPATDAARAALAQWEGGEK